MRVFALAYSGHHRNRHCGFEPGGLHRALSYVDTVTGEVYEFSRQAVHQAISTAVEYGYLDTKSNANCLVVPPFISGGNLGKPHAVCRRHGSDS